MTDKLPDIKVGDIFRHKDPVANGTKKTRMEVIFVNEETVVVKYLERKLTPFAFTHETVKKCFEKIVPKPRYFMNIYGYKNKEGVFCGAIHKSLEQAMGFRSNHYLKTIELTDLINEE